MRRTHGSYMNSEFKFHKASSNGTQAHSSAVSSSVAALATKAKLTSCHKAQQATTTYIWPFTPSRMVLFQGDFFLPQGIQNTVDGPRESESTET